MAIIFWQTDWIATVSQWISFLREQVTAAQNNNKHKKYYEVAENVKT
jgi:hypothetical protein